MNKRLFIAIKYKPNDIILNFIKDLKIDFENDKIKWVDSNNMHLTIKFHGDTDTAKIPGLIEHLHGAVENNKPVLLSVEKLGAFYRGKFPSVLFLNLSENIQLFNLVNAISEASELCGFSKEKRKFKAHITLARIKFIKDLSLFKEILDTEVNQTFMLDRFYLFESKLTPKGAIYNVVEEFVL